MSRSTRLPYIKLFPGDELQSAVTGCSMGAQGLWFRLRLIMHTCEPYGYLCPGGPVGTLAGQSRDISGTSPGTIAGQHADIARTPPSDMAIARKCGITVQEYLELRNELDEAGVTSYTVSHVMYCERLVQDAIDRADWANRKRKQRPLPFSVGQGDAGTNAGQARDNGGTKAVSPANVPPMSQRSSLSLSYSNKKGVRRGSTEASRREQRNREVEESFSGPSGG